jgi:hypothetical protein
MSISFTYQSREYVLDYQALNEELPVICFNGKSEPAQSEDQINQTLNQILCEIENNHRLEALYNPPREHFDYYFKHYLTSNDQMYIEDIRSHLLGIYSSEEIEACYFKKPNINKVEAPGLRIYVSMEQTYVIPHTGHPFQAFKSDQREQLEAYITEIVNHTAIEQSKNLIARI